LEEEEMKHKTHLFIIISVLVLFSWACGLPAGLLATQTPEASNTPRATKTDRPTETDSPTETPEMPSATPRPTYTATPEYTPTLVPQPYYLDELEGDVSRWYPPFITYGDENGYTVVQDDTGLMVTVNAADTYVYLENSEYTYGDVRLDVLATNYGFNDNNISLICRASNAGWYEASAFSSGLYYIYLYSGGYTVLKDGGIISMRTGRHQNKFTLTCQGNQIIFGVNDVEIARLTDSTFTEGMVGLNISTYDTLPVEVHFESVQVSAP
jgi:hypothetical protein